jgi:hypothetical protein
MVVAVCELDPAEDRQQTATAIAAVARHNQRNIMHPGAGLNG